MDRVTNKHCSRTDECYTALSGWQVSGLRNLKRYLSLILPFSHVLLYILRIAFAYVPSLAPVGDTRRAFLMRGLVNDVE
ncbi:hypothetical protein ACKUB1_14825 [Methanospirillum stamsii]|uniref:hypothetical protein n=1 Tax=Methanospirillum stamsii TaxID=1277351 RepID=UPI0011B281CF|nr:hypothetical protein [Methanospirillum stamsii]